jgi:hypothetical protein
MMLRAATVFILLATLAAELGAQVTPPTKVSPPRIDSLRTARLADSLRRAGVADTAIMRILAADSVKSAGDSVTLAPPDSMMRALLARPGFEFTRYEGDSARFNSVTHNLVIFGVPSVVLYVDTKITGTSISFDDLRQRLTVSGAPAIIDDPKRGEPVIAYDPITYDIASQRGTAGDVRTKAESGAIWCMTLGRTGFIRDSAGPVLMGKDVSLSTDCNPNPHYHFEVGELKRVGSNTLVGSPAKLYIGEVPILWLPWFWQPAKRGRNSGLLTPRFGFAELVRNNSSYRRTVENVGFYWAPSDYYDGEFSLDWRSGARPRPNDAGFVRLNGDIRYVWRDKFISGGFGVSHTNQNDGGDNLQLDWNHKQDFSKKTNLTLNFQYVTNTQVLAQTAINPFIVIGSIVSQANYQTGFGPLRVSIGGTQRQYAGRESIERTLPTLNVSSAPIDIASWLTWTPSFNTSVQQSLHLDTPSDFAFRRFLTPEGLLDSVRTNRSSRNSSLTFGSPVKVGSFTISANVRMDDRENNFPEAKIVIDPVDTSLKRTVVYKRTYLTTLDWDVGVNLPSFFQGTWNLVPSVQLANVDPGAFLVRSERSGADFVGQSKRALYGLSSSPTLHHVYPGIGPFTAIRHSINPSISYRYSPEASVSNEFLAALGRVRPGYLGALAQNRISLSFSQVFEAKTKADSGDGEKKIRLLSMNLSPIEYDFELAKATGRVGIATDQVSATMQSDLLPGFNFQVGYSLFDAPVISDTARFSPRATSLQATMNFGANGAKLGFLGRAFHWMTGERPVTAPRPDSVRAQTSGSIMGTPASLPGFGRGRQFQPGLVDLQPGQPWQLSLSITSNHPRPPHGANVVDVDPTRNCQQFRDVNPAQFDICVRQSTPVNISLQNTQTTGGGIAYRIPPTTSVSANFGFSLTRYWTAQWNTMYDVEEGQFATQIISLQRELKDWRANFGFTQAANGNFAFTFVVALKPAPDLKLDYYRPGYPATTTR